MSNPAASNSTISMRRIDTICQHLAPSCTSGISLAPNNLAAEATASTAAPATSSSSSSTQPSSTQYGGYLAAQAFLEQGVTHVFTLTGGHIAPILVGCESAKIRVIDVRHEATTVFAADAYSRLTGTVGVAVVTAGPGLTNTMTACVNAKMAQVPVVIIGGATAMILKGRGSLQDIDQLALIDSACKAKWSLTTVSDIIPTLRKAFRIAQEGVPGPVFLEFPIELLWPEQTIAEQIGVKREAPALFPLSRASISQSLKYFYLNRHLNNVFHNAFAPIKPLTPIEIQQQRHYLPVTQSAVRTVHQAIAASQSPIMLIGSQAIRAGKDIKSGVEHTTRLRQAIEQIGVPVFLSGMARGLLGSDHPLLMRHNRSKILKASTFVILVGVPSDFRLDYGRHIPSTAKFFTINLCEKTLAKNSDIRSADLKVHADPMEFVIQLGQTFAAPSSSSPPPSASSTSASSSSPSASFTPRKPTWYKFLSEQQQQREHEIDRVAQGDAAKKLVDAQGHECLHPIRLCRIIDELLPSNSTIIGDGGDFVATASYTIRPRHALGWLDPGVFGTLGVGGGFALAAAAAHPQELTVLLYGDGASGFSLMEFDTFARARTPVLAIIGNDSCWSQMYRDQIRLLKSPVATELAQTRYDQVVEGLGGKGLLVRNEKEMRDGFAQAMKWIAEGYSVCMNCVIAKSSFREGSISL